MIWGKKEPHKATVHHCANGCKLMKRELMQWKEYPPVDFK
jgi:hypothetical protein